MCCKKNVVKKGVVKKGVVKKGVVKKLWSNEGCGVTKVF